LEFFLGATGRKDDGKSERENDPSEKKRGQTERGREDCENRKMQAVLSFTCLQGTGLEP
jgi:hypothetical protein